MKNFWLAITVFILCNNQVTAQQKVLDRMVTLHHADVPLENVLQEIFKLTAVQFSYSDNLIPVQEEVTIHVEDENLDIVLKKLFENFPIAYHTIGNRIILKYTDLRQTIKGTVVDKFTKTPIFGANVMVAGTDPVIGTSTDINGKFKLNNVPVGRRHISINMLGYEPKEIPNILIGTGKEIIMEIPLTEAIQSMEEIIIQANGNWTTPVNELAVVSGRSFTVEETKRYAASVGDPGRLALAFPGVTVGDDGTNEIIIRGNSPSGLLWRIEGVEIPSPNHFTSEGASTGGISIFSTNVMSRSDFLTSAFPAEYGNALAGVFDIHLRKGNNEKREYTIQAGFLGLDLATEGPFKKGGKSSYLFNYRYSTLSILKELNFDVQEDNEENIFQDLSFKMVFPTAKLGTFSAFGVGGLSTFKENIPDVHNDEEIYNIGVVGLSNQYSIGPKTFVRTTISLSGTRSTDDFEVITAAPDRNISETEFTKSFARASLVINRKINPRHFVEAGGTYSRLGFNFNQNFENTFNEFPFQRFERFNDEGHSSSTQAYTSWQYRISDQWSLVSGVHLLHFAFNNETSIEPRAGLKWQLRPDQSINAGFGLHSRIESLEYYLGNFINDDGTSTQFNRDLGLTKARHYVLGYENQLATNLLLKLEAYYQDLFNVPVFTDPENNAFSTLLLTDGYTVEPLVNEGSGENYGLEMTLERTFADNYYFLANVSVYEAKYTAKDGVQRDSRFNGNFNSNLLIGKEFLVGKNGKNNIFGINIKTIWAGSQRTTPIDLEFSRAENREIRPLDQVFTERFDNYFRMDLQLNFRKNKPKYTSEWRLDIQNVTSHQNVLEDFYSARSQRIVQEKQQGLIPVLSYRVEF